MYVDCVGKLFVGSKITVPTLTRSRIFIYKRREYSLLFSRKYDSQRVSVTVNWFILIEIEHQNNPINLK